MNNIKIGQQVTGMTPRFVAVQGKLIETFSVATTGKVYASIKQADGKKISVDFATVKAA